MTAKIYTMCTDNSRFIPKKGGHGIAPNNEQLEVALNQLEETLGDY